MNYGNPMTGLRAVKPPRCKPGRGRVKCWSVRECSAVDHSAPLLVRPQEASVSALFATTLERCGRIDILVNNAGTNIRHPAHELSLAQWHTVIVTNLTSAFMCAKAAYPTFKRCGGGKIINIGSMMSIFGASFAPAYAASKGGIVQLTRSLASAWARDNIQANAVLPGWIDTDLSV